MDGDFWVGYSARLRYGALSVPYSSILDARVQRQSLVWQTPELIRGGEEIHWRVPALDIEARWQRFRGDT